MVKLHTINVLLKNDKNAMETLKLNEIRNI